MVFTDSGADYLDATGRRRASSLKVVVVEDDREVRQFIERVLREDGFDVEARATAGSLASSLVLGEVAAIILDVCLADANGIDVCAAWRSAGISTPILILSAHTDVASRVAGLDAGADDYLGKPFALAELRARLRALVRRGPRKSEQVLRYGSVVVDFQWRRAWVARSEVPLTEREFAVLERLAREKGHAVSRPELLADVWGDASTEAGNSLDVILARLRRKLVGSNNETLIRTIRGYGHAIAAPSGDATARRRADKG
jgi:DNA-binding response OmpR family regulator